MHVDVGLAGHAAFDSAFSNVVYSWEQDFGPEKLFGLH